MTDPSWATSAHQEVMPESMVSLGVLLADLRQGTDFPSLVSRAEQWEQWQISPRRVLGIQPSTAHGLLVIESRNFPQTPPPMSLHPIVSNRSLGSKQTKLMMASSLNSSFLPNFKMSTLVC